MTDAGASSAAVMADAQLSIAGVLRPFPGFEQKYQGVPSSRPIAIPGTLDPRAGTAGYSANLLAGVAVPQGARLLLWIPVCRSGETVTDYSYTLVWRMKTPNPGSVYHLGRTLPGAPGPSDAERRTVPAAYHVVGFEATEPTSGPGEITIRVEKVTPVIDGESLELPLAPNGEDGVLEQGVISPDTVGDGSPSYVPFWTDVEGDELIILARRTDAGEEDTWDFAGADAAFSNLYGTGNGDHPVYPVVGILMQTGTTS